MQVLSSHLRDPAAPGQTVAAAVGQFGRLDLLVNNAGATKRADFFTLTDEDWAGGFALKFHGHMRMTRAAWPHLRERKGSIVNIVGIGSRPGPAEFTIGGPVNVALLNVTKAMGGIGISQGVRVNAINPGLIATDRFTRNVERAMNDRGFTREQALTFLVSPHGTARVGQPEEIGSLVAYLASVKADFIQGCIIDIDIDIDIDGGATRSL